MKTVLEKIEGCLAGGAVGDAMGAPAECMHYKFIEKKVGRITKQLNNHITGPANWPYTGGKFTDDTYIARIVMDAILARRGRIRAEDLANALLEHVERLGRVPFEIGHQECNLARLKYGYPPRMPQGSGMVPWNQCVAPMAIYPVGIVNACHPRNAAWDAYDVAQVLQSETDALDICAALAAAVAEALKPDATVASVIEAALAFVGPSTQAAIQAAVKLAKRVNDVYAIRAPYYRKLLYSEPLRTALKLDSETTSTSGHNFEIVPAAFAMFVIAKGDPRIAILGGANFGRDCDTIAGIAGFLSGALKGVHAIPSEWVTHTEQANKVKFSKMAETLHAAARHALKEADLQLKCFSGQSL